MLRSGSGTPFRAAVAADVDSLKPAIAHGADLEWAPKRVEGAPPMPFGDNTGPTPPGWRRGKGQLMTEGRATFARKDRVFRELVINRRTRSAAAQAAQTPTVEREGDSALHIAAHDGAAIRGRRAEPDQPAQQTASGSSAVEKMNAKIDPIARWSGCSTTGAARGDGCVSPRATAAEEAAAGPSTVVDDDFELLRRLAAESSSPPPRHVEPPASTCARCRTEVQ